MDNKEKALLYAGLCATVSNCELVIEQAIVDLSEYLNEAETRELQDLHNVLYKKSEEFAKKSRSLLELP